MRICGPRSVHRFRLGVRGTKALHPPALAPAPNGPRGRRRGFAPAASRPYTTPRHVTQPSLKCAKHPPWRSGGGRSATVRPGPAGRRRGRPQTSAGCRCRASPGGRSRPACRARSTSTIGIGMCPQPSPARRKACLAPRSARRQVCAEITPNSRPRRYGIRQARRLRTAGRRTHSLFDPATGRPRLAATAWHLLARAGPRPTGKPTWRCYRTHCVNVVFTWSAARRLSAAMVSVGLAVAEVGKTAEPRMKRFG
jgi:hypothetical protein